VLWGLRLESSVDSLALRGETLRTPSGPEGSSGKWLVSGAVGKPSWSWLLGASPRSGSTAGARSQAIARMLHGPKLREVVAETKCGGAWWKEGATGKWVDAPPKK